MSLVILFLNPVAYVQPYISPQYKEFTRIYS